MNKVTLIGNVGNEPEVITFDSGDKIVKLNLATSEYWKDKQTGEKRSQTEWHNVVIQGNVASVAENYVKKGDKIAVSGKNRTRQWESKTGEKRYTTEVICRELELLTAKGGSDKQNPQTAVNGFDNTEESLPF